MPPTTQNLQDSLRAQNPRSKNLKPFPKRRTPTGSPYRSQPPSLSSFGAPSRSLHTKRSCSQALFRFPNPSAEPSFSVVPSLSRPRIITLPSSSTQSNPVSTSTMPLTTSAETHVWLQERGMGGYLKVIDAPAHPDAQQVARKICPEAITNSVLRTALDLQQGGDHDVDIPSAAKLKEYFGEYSASGKAYRTYGGPNKVFGEIARILMEYAFVHTNPTSMPQNKAAIIISAYEGHRVDGGIITGEGLRATIASFQSGKKMLSIVMHFLTMLFPPSSLPSPRKLTLPPPP